MLSGTLGEILQKLSTTLDTYPRRVPGKMTIEGIPFEYVDIASFYHQSYQLFVQQLYDFESSVPAPFIIDCGAHVGLASLFFKLKYPSARVLAFEADPDIATRLLQNVSAFNMNDVDVQAKAVWINEDGVTFSKENDDSGFVGGGGQSVISVPTVRLKSILEKTSVELLKLDIEGAEFSVIKDCRGSMKNVQKVLVEVHLFRGQNKLSELLAVLEDEGFKYSISDLNQAVWMPSASKPPFHQIKTENYYLTVFGWKA